MDFPLHRRVAFVRGDDDLLDLLRTPCGVASLVCVEPGERKHEGLAAIRHHATRVAAGPDVFALLARP